jgi:hypothetical protein
MRIAMIVYTRALRLGPRNITQDDDDDDDDEKEETD